MSRLPSLWLGLVPLTILILLQAEDCPGTAPQYVVKEFQLTSCPDSSFSFPDSGSEAPYRFSAVSTKAASWCPRFRGYTLAEGGEERLQAAVSLVRSPSCSVQLAYSYNPGEERRTHLGAEGDKWASFLALYLMRNSRTSLPLSEAKTETFDSYKAVQGWCARTSGTSPSNGATR